MNRHDLKVPLPPNETDRENVFAKLADRLFDIENPTRSLFDPDTCPVEFLPYLAWARSVDVWDDAWSESRKRNVIRNAPEVHRLKGTRYAVELALASYDANADIREWFEIVPFGVPGTFSVDIRQDAFDYSDLRLRGQIDASVRASKPKSRTVDLRFWLADGLKAFTGAVARVHTAIHVLAIPVQPVLSPALPRVGCGTRIHVNIRVFA